MPQAAAVPAEVIDPADILNADQVAERLHRPRTWIYEQCRARSRSGFPFAKAGKYPVFRWSHICQWLNERPQPRPGRKPRKYRISPEVRAKRKAERAK